MEKSFTRALADKALAVNFDALPLDIVKIARHCLLDWLGVTVAGAGEPLSAQLGSVLSAQGSGGRVSIPGTGMRLPSVNAAFMTGTASHAMDYDDVTFSVPGHASAPVLAATFSLAEEIGASGRQVLEAFVAGYETTCRVGVLMAPSHYAKGFHATATAGVFGATAASAHLLGLGTDTLAIAFGIAATRAAGLKASFGTSCKPLQSGNAASTGLLAALLAHAGFDGPANILEHRIGVAALLSSDFNADIALGVPSPVHDFSEAPQIGSETAAFHLAFNLFKYHASCYETHSAIECGSKVAAKLGQNVAQIKSVRLRVNRHLNDICNIKSPVTGLEAKFSLRLNAAFGLAKALTADPALFSAENALDPAFVALRDKIDVELDDDIAVPVNTMTVTLADGRTFEATHDSSRPATDLPAQGERLKSKFMALSEGKLGLGRSQQVVSAVDALHEMASIEPFMALLRV
jgi:2-methylcitrate dehydratase PrpD